MFDFRKRFVGRVATRSKPSTHAGFGLPESPKSVLFVEGPDQVALIAAFAEGPEAMTIENLMIGTSHDYIPDHKTPYDFSAAIAALMIAKMPALRRLIVGEMELLFSGHGYYGHLGDVTDLFGIAPNLTELRLCGRATLPRPVRHDRLQRLSVVADDLAGNSGAPDPETVLGILSSHFPNWSSFTCHWKQTRLLHTTFRKPSTLD